MIEDSTLDIAEQVVDHEFLDRALLRTALTHASCTDSRLDSYERLEFLGDAVLGLIACEMIFAEHPDMLEGEMTKIKSIVVSREICAVIAADIGLVELVALGKGMRGASSLPTSLAAGVFEAVIAALYLDAGFEHTIRFVRPLLGPHVERAQRNGHQQNFKSLLQQHAQHSESDSPRYLILDEKGPDHAKCFRICVEIGSRRFDASWGPSKKHAEQQAARLALIELSVLEESDAGELVVAHHAQTDPLDSHPV